MIGSFINMFIPKRHRKRKRLPMTIFPEDEVKKIVRIPEQEADKELSNCWS